MKSVPVLFAEIIESSSANSASYLYVEKTPQVDQVISMLSGYASTTDCKFDVVAIDENKPAFEQTQVSNFVLISDALEQLGTEKGSLLLGQLRNLGVRQIAALVDNDSDWAFTDFLGLGFRKHVELEPSDHPNDSSANNHRSYTLYTYNLDNYNHKRTWNNPRFWANPEMWNKARW